MSYEAGAYLFKVTSQGFGKAKTGSDFFFLEGTPVAVLQDGQEFSVEPSPRTIRLAITEKSVQFAIDKLTAIGWAGGRWGTLDPTENGFHNFVGDEVRAVCTKEPGFNDASKLFEKWDLPFSGSEPTEHDPSVSRKLDALFGKSLPKNGAAKPAPRPAKAAAPSRQPLKLPVDSSGSEVPDDDSIPF